ncbi:MAG: DNA-binding response regulator [Elusimicrobia bacterium GWA2_69_24]|nr:MAG: DNA-binding response regulator [Elusimicrobia bacterium GWA2_69_24]
MPGEKVLVVEDDKSIVKVLRYNLEKEGYSVTHAGDGESALDIARRDAPQLVILDVLLPKMDGFEVCRRLRGESRIPVLMLTAKADEVDRILGLELGADDYLTKPFSVRELLARVKALLRRAAPAPGSGAPLRFGSLEVHPERFEARLAGAPVALSPIEYKLLKTLLDARGAALTREDLLRRAWGIAAASELDTRTVDQHVLRLRKKLGKEADRLVTVKAVGYRFATD